MMSVKWNFILLFLFSLMAGYGQVQLICYCKGSSQTKKEAGKKYPFPDSQMGRQPPADQKAQKQWSDKGQSKLTEHCQIPDYISPLFHKNLLLKVSFYRQILTHSRVNGNFICENCLKINLYFLSYRQFFHTSKSNYMLANLFVFVAIQSFRID